MSLSMFIEYHYGWPPYQDMNEFLRLRSTGSAPVDGVFIFATTPHH
jgi:hypothetical protein